MWRYGKITLAIVIASASFYYVYLAFSRQTDALLSFRPHSHTATWMILSFMLIGLSAVCAAGAWHGALRAFDISLSARTAFAVALTSQVAKYIPGNVGQHVGRIGLLRRFNCPLGDSIKATLLDGLSLPLAAAALLAVCAFSPQVVAYLIELITQPGLISHRLVERFEPIYAWPTNLVVSCCAVIICIGVQTIIYQFLRRGRARPVPWPSLMPTSSTAYIMLSHAGAFVMAGASLQAAITAVAVDVAAWQLIWVSIVAFVAAGVAGYIFPGAPAGLGVREALLLFSLTQVTGEVSAVLAVALHRLISIAADIAAFGLGAALLAFCAVERPSPNIQSVGSTQEREPK